ncbi:hypothetical protein WA026_011899 [Henosepilachna vigintioctopunctata]|uniref:Uncharacterized protein n=2 Tax=Henosepilachna vigintioctopunctata TaxID=420089 RepID=A0AAW1UAJ4_9CUCU
MGLLQFQAKCYNSWKNVNILLPHFWPKELQLQIYFVLSFVLLGLKSLINAYTPIYNKLIVDSLSSNKDENSEFRWDLICIFVVLKYFQEIDEMRDVLWTKVEQSMKVQVEVSIFSHIQSLSLRWHLKRKTGEVMKVIDRSANGVNSLVHLICFSMLPTIFDIFVSVSYFSIVFDFWLGLTVFTCMLIYFVVSYKGTTYGNKLRKVDLKTANELRNKSLDSLLNFETVKYFGNEKYEINNFEKAVKTLYDGELKSRIIYATMDSLQNFVINTSLLIGSLLCAYKVRTNELTLGHYVMFSTYIVQLYSSVDWFDYFVRAIQRNLVDIENVLEVLKEEQEVSDSPDARELEVTDGAISFNNVFFEYVPNQPILKNISFEVPPGGTVAFVGPSGAGKSTIMRLLLRFYDVCSGSIIIDGQNIKDVTQESLRKAIGVVPQDTVLFNDTIGYNIKYGRLQSEEDDIIEAAKGADIHDKILTFKDKFATEVGERGLRLSGGEKQRVAIARTLLKSPHIVILDEATSALDSKTEQNIQKSLQRVCSGRTTIMVAHRLSTIIHADQIIVLSEGKIIERGRHSDLLEMDGVYASMWKLQLSSNNRNEMESS